MKNYMNADNKTQFIRARAAELMADGEPHRCRQILDHVRACAVGTKYEGTIAHNLLIQALCKMPCGENSPYTRIRHGIYQLSTMAESVYPQAEPQSCTLYDLLDDVVELQNKMHEAFSNQAESMPECEEKISPVYQATIQKAEELLDCMSVWLAETEDLNLEETLCQENQPDITMQTL